MNIDLRFPIGNFVKPEKFDEETRRGFIKIIAELPQKLRLVCQGLNETQLETPYRPEGWTIKQVVHHVADSHANSLIRFKLGLTEEIPLIKTYREELWAELADSKDVPIEISLQMIEAIHFRWSVLLNSMKPNDFERNLRHPDHGEVSLNYMLGLYAWHSEHHFAHISNLITRENW